MAESAMTQFCNELLAHSLTVVFTAIDDQELRHILTVEARSRSPSRPMGRGGKTGATTAAYGAARGG